LIFLSIPDLLNAILPALALNHSHDLDIDLDLLPRPSRREETGDPDLVLTPLKSTANFPNYNRELVNPTFMPQNR
jgi:hypothetical protein